MTLTLSSTNAQESYLVIGTYTEAKPDKGIYVYSFNKVSGELAFVSHGENITNPSFLILSANGKFVYACSETQMPNSGNISAFRFNDGTLTFINKTSSGGDNPAYLALHKSGKVLVIANYSSGSASVIRIKKDGSLEPDTTFQFTGKSIIAGRQDSPHIHAAVFSPNHDFVFLTDLGSDRIWSYAIGKKLNFKRYPAGDVITEPGSGPRHLVFHSTKKFAYCIEELSGTVSGYSYNNGKLSSIQRIATHDASVKGPYGSADIHISPDGKFLYASNRGNENTISIFSINPTTGILTFVANQSTLGIHPRNFTLDQTGNFLFVANMLSNDIIVFKRDQQTGLLTETPVKISVPKPACLRLIDNP
ncbi:MAG: lactonase family protein [Cyclobacteriaceae bacterium]|nr:lactonase family protein [Cyclobacteriaceae bacterium]